MVPRNSPKAYNTVISLPKLAAVMTRPLAARPIQRAHATAGDSSPAALKRTAWPLSHQPATRREPAAA